MGKMILVEGAPGTGKSRAIMNLNPETTLLIKPNGKDLPFPGSRTLYKEGVNVVRVSDFSDIRVALEAVNKGKKFTVVVIEDEDKCIFIMILCVINLDFKNICCIFV